MWKFLKHSSFRAWPMLRCLTCSHIINYIIGVTTNTLTWKKKHRNNKKRKKYEKYENNIHWRIFLYRRNSAKNSVELQKKLIIYVNMDILHNWPNTQNKNNSSNSAHDATGFVHYLFFWPMFYSSKTHTQIYVYYAHAPPSLLGF